MDTRLLDDLLANRNKTSAQDSAKLEVVVAAPDISVPTYEPYRPVSLPALPRTRCAHSILVEQRDKRMKSGACTGKPLVHGWCKDHAFSHEFLCLGASLGYPHVELNQYLALLGGVVNWEGHAECFSSPKIIQHIAHIRSVFQFREPLPDGRVPAFPAPPNNVLLVQKEEYVLSYDLEALSSTCTICSAEVAYYSNAGVAYCAQHWPYDTAQELIPEGALCCECDTPAKHASPGGSTYCDTHYQCRRGHPPRWRYDESGGIWLCTCYWEYEVAVPLPRRGV